MNIATQIASPMDAAKLDRLAEVAVKVGLRLQPGQDLFLTAPAAALRSSNSRSITT